MKEQFIYVVTTLESLDFRQDIRTVGWFETYSDAEQEVIHNSCDINEGSYDYAIIEKIGMGFYPPCPSKTVFKFNYQTDQYEPIDLPSELEYITNIGIG
jgi:hypothetical protein